MHLTQTVFLSPLLDSILLSIREAFFQQPPSCGIVSLVLLLNLQSSRNLSSVLMPFYWIIIDNLFFYCYIFSLFSFPFLAGLHTIRLVLDSGFIHCHKCIWPHLLYWFSVLLNICTLESGIKLFHVHASITIVSLHRVHTTSFLCV